MAYISGDRYQLSFFPQSIDEMVPEDDPVRAYDAIIDKIFEEVKPHINYNEKKAGAHEYNPRNMLKVLVYSYSYGFRSSRKIERALYHNLSYIWISGGIKPDHWTISDFRRQNTQLIKEVLKSCARLCIKLNLIEGNVLFVDGSKFRADASISNTWNAERCESEMKRVCKKIEILMDECEKADREETGESYVKLKDELRDEQKRKEKIEAVWEHLKTSGKESVNTTDPECVKAKSRQGKHASYNVQLVTDNKNGLIVSAEAVSEGVDYNQFSKQMKNAEETLGKPPQTGCADSGYSSVDDLEQVENKMNVVVPTTRQTNEEREGPSSNEFEKKNFIYDPDRDRYFCPGDRVLWHVCTKETGEKIYKAKAKVCRKCKFFNICTQSKNGRTITRLKNEEVKERLEKNYKTTENQKIYSHRKERAELPFGHIKRNLGAGQFLLRGKEKVNTETSILATVFNISRMLTLLGTDGIIDKMGKIGREFLEKHWENIANNFLAA